MKSYMNHTIRIGTLIMILGGCLCCIAILFWRQELKYQLPTPIPKDYREVAVGQQVMLPPRFVKTKAHFIHFYNPDCPCSRFNAQHLNSLIGEYKDSISIVVVVPAATEIAKARSTFGDVVGIVADDNGTIAEACGVYSTPQAAIIDKDGNLYYRGNYNTARYCTSRATNFAELSLIALINNNPPPAFGMLATQSYGCGLEETSPPTFASF